MASLKNKSENSKALMWIYQRSKRYVPAVILIAFFSILVSLSTVALALVTKKILDIATGDSEGKLAVFGLILLLLSAIQISLNCYDRWLKYYIEGKLMISIRNYLFSAVAKKNYAKISGYHSGDILNRFVADIEAVVASVINIIPNVSAMIAKIIGAISALFILNSKIAIIVITIGLFVPAMGRLINRRFKTLHKECMKTEGETRSFLQECFENIVVIKTFISESPFLKKLNQYLKTNFKIRMKRNSFSLLTHTGLNSFFTVGYYIILLWGASQISNSAITYGTLTAFLQLVNQLRAPLQNVSGVIPQYFSAIASAERIMELEEGNDDLSPIVGEQLNRIKNEFETLEVNNVTFGYKDEVIIKDCSFVAQKGKITAITGESGSGKSTIFKILLGLYEPQEGNITIDGKTVLDTSYRGLFAYVPQGNLLLSGTIRENISLCDTSISEDEIIKAAKTAEIFDLIESMPDGLDTVLAERGAGLSEGQIQRISLARAILTDAPILLLDEATSALDEETETRVLSNIKAFSDKTILFVTHRNTSLKVCDKIVHLSDGKIDTIKE